MRWNRPPCARSSTPGFKRVILNLGQGALTIVANTIMHPEDLPSRLLGEIKEGRLTNWIGLRWGHHPGR